MVGNQAAAKRYKCSACGTLQGWAARCSSCNQFKLVPYEPSLFDPPTAAAPPAATAPSASPVTLVAAPVIPIPTGPPMSVPVPSSEIPAESYVRYRTGLDPLDDVLGGGLVKGSLVLLGADPGASKSTAVSQALAWTRVRCLYATGEETVAQVGERTRRLETDSPIVYIVAETRVEIIMQHSLTLAAEVLAIDSIQTLFCDEAPGRAGSISQMKECIHRLMHFAKTTGTIVIVIGHVTQDGALAGPKTLEHMVDTVLMLEVVDQSNDRRLITTKNRFGSTAKIGRLVMTSTGLEPAPYEAPEEPADDDDSGNIH